MSETMITKCTDMQRRDLAHLWHPCSQMKDYESFLPLEVVSAKGAYLHLADGSTLIDSGSSWWCKAFGHAHPALMAALRAQSERFDHVILANTAQSPAVDLAERLASLCPNLNKVFYASDGSCAVEIALKMSLHSRMITGDPRRELAALRGGYHGETMLTLSVSDVGMYKDPYKQWNTPCHMLGPLPMVTGPADPLWHDCSEHWESIAAQLAPLANRLTAIILEPILQAAGGMQLYSMDLLRRLRRWCDQHGVHLIADEIMTGFGRTGKALALDHANIEADFVCLGKGLTGGVLPLSAVLTSDAMYALFYDDYSTGKAFLHSHTHSGNALACAVGVAAFDLLHEDGLMAHVNELGDQMRAGMEDIAKQTGELHRIRQLGAMVAADLKNPTHPRAGYQLYQAAVKQGVLLRPLGNTIYWCPPLNCLRDTVISMAERSSAAISISLRNMLT